ncbi:hypothetical protein F4677DRAFT_461530 [Hypoxylon crocopeplum]|nr:hypothetical protein F4677DRAFT_461530 [Hypoxylon crocopeplum]
MSATTPTPAGASVRIGNYWSSAECTKLLLIIMQEGNPNFEVKDWKTIGDKANAVFGGKFTPVAVKHQFQRMRHQFMEDFAFPIKEQDEQDDQDDGEATMATPKGRKRAASTEAGAAITAKKLRVAKKEDSDDEAVTGEDESVVDKGDAAIAEDDAAVDNPTDSEYVADNTTDGEYVVDDSHDDEKTPVKAPPRRRSLRLAYAAAEAAAAEVDDPLTAAEDLDPELPGTRMTRAQTIAAAATANDSYLVAAVDPAAAIITAADAAAAASRAAVVVNDILAALEAAKAAGRVETKSED